MALRAGSVLGRYRLVAPLGAGGMGEVWSATHVLTGRRVAIKRLHPAAHDTSFDVAKARFLLEARSACVVNHPNVVEVYDVVDRGGDAPFLVMELLRGETLAARLQREPVMSYRMTADLLLPVVSAVGTAHARGIVHRDLKPSNIFLVTASDAGPDVKVLDFGIAKWVAAAPDGGGPRTATGAMLGTPSYMAPEQATGERVIDQRADVWALGVILYECLSGSRPIEGDNPTQVMLRLWSSGIMPIERLVPDLPESWAGLIMRMLSRDPNRRPVDLREAYELLSAHSQRQSPGFGQPSSEAQPPGDSNRNSDGHGTPGSVLGDDDMPPPMVPPTSSRRARASRWLVPLVVAVGVAFLGRELNLRSATEQTGAAVVPSATEPSEADMRQTGGARAAGTAAEASSTGGAHHAEGIPLQAAPTPSHVAERDDPSHFGGVEAPVARRPPAAGLSRSPARPSRPVSSIDSTQPRTTPARAPAPSPPAEIPTAAPVSAPRPGGAPCERSEDCQSGYCVALSCR